MARALGQLAKPISRTMYQLLVGYAVDKGIVVWAQADLLIAMGRRNDTASRSALKELEQEGYIYRDRYVTSNGGQGKLVVLTPDFLSALNVTVWQSDYPF